MSENSSSSSDEELGAAFNVGGSDQSSDEDNQVEKQVWRIDTFWGNSSKIILFLHYIPSVLTWKPEAEVCSL